MRTQIVTIPTDTIPIDGAFHEPDTPARGAVLYFHGNTMNFYTGAARFLAPALTDLGLAFLAFNRRGHDILTTRASRAAEGGAFQTIAESIADNRFAAQWLAGQGYANPVIAGHSNVARGRILPAAARNYSPWTGSANSRSVHASWWPRAGAASSCSCPAGGM